MKWDGTTKNFNGSPIAIVPVNRPTKTGKQAVAHLKKANIAACAKHGRSIAEDFFKKEVVEAIFDNAEALAEWAGIPRFNELGEIEITTFRITPPSPTEPDFENDELAQILKYLEIPF